MLSWRIHQRADLLLAAVGCVVAAAAFTVSVLAKPPAGAPADQLAGLAVHGWAASEDGRWSFTPTTDPGAWDRMYVYPIVRFFLEYLGFKERSLCVS